MQRFLPVFLLFFSSPFFSQTVHVFGGTLASFYYGNKNRNSFTAGVNVDLQNHEKSRFFFTPSLRYSEMKLRGSAFWVSTWQGEGPPPSQFDLSAKVIETTYRDVLSLSCYANIKLNKSSPYFLYLGIGPKLESSFHDYTSVGIGSVLGFKYDYRAFSLGTALEFSVPVHNYEHYYLNSWLSSTLSVGYKLNYKASAGTEAKPEAEKRSSKVVFHLTPNLAYIFDHVFDAGKLIDKKPGLWLSGGISLEEPLGKRGHFSGGISFAYLQNQVNYSFQDGDFYLESYRKNQGLNLEIPFVFRYYLFKKGYALGGLNFIYKIKIKSFTSYKYEQENIILETTDLTGKIIPAVKLGIGYDLLSREKMTLFCQPEFQFRLLPKQDYYFMSPSGFYLIGLQCGIRF